MPGGHPILGRLADAPRPRGHFLRDRIGESARDRLLASSYLALRAISCSCRDGVLTLRGCLPSHHQKQLALAIVADVEGVREVDNQIHVALADSREAAGGDEAWRKVSAGRGLPGPSP